jgi:hypothetical protein
VASEDDAAGAASDEDAASEDDAASDDDAGAASDEVTTAELGAVSTGGVPLPRLKIQMRPMMMITATMMMIQVLRFMG